MIEKFFNNKFDAGDSIFIIANEKRYDAGVAQTEISL